MKDYNLNIVINTILKNSWITNLNNSLKNVTNTSINLTEKLADTSSKFVLIRELAWTLKEKLWGFFCNDWFRINSKMN